MAGNAYPHIVFAKTADVLPQQTLADLLTSLFPDAQVEQGEIKAQLTLEDYTYTFWYDDDAEGLGERYADYANPLRRKRVSRCTTMIDASGDVDPTGVRARDVHRIMAALAERDGVYVFSEETKRFVGMEYEDAAPVTSVVEPEADPRSDVSPAAHAGDGAREVVLGREETSGAFPHTEEAEVDRPRESTGTPDGRETWESRTTWESREVADAAEAGDTSRTVETHPGEAPMVVSGEPVRDEPVVTGEPQRDPASPLERPAPAPAPLDPVIVPADEDTVRRDDHGDRDAGTAGAAHVEEDRATTEPVREEQDKPGLFKRLFGRKR